jgi:hypothetical protein
VAFEDLTDETGLARRVEVGGAAGDRGLNRRLAPAHERPDRRDEHVAASHQRAHRRGPLDVGHHGLQAAQLVGQRP